MTRQRRRGRGPVLAMAAWALAATWAAAAGTAPPQGDDAGPPEVIRSPAAIGEVAFPHSLHADDLGFDCTDCHHEINAKSLEMPHAEYFDDFWIDCRICHRGDVAVAPRACGDCHHEAPSTLADETLSSKVVVHKSCWACHEAGTGSEASRNCGFCHRGQEEGES